MTSDGLAGVNVARDQQPDIILLDLWMSTHGWETARQLRRNPETAWIPIVAVTAHAMAGTDFATAGDDGRLKSVIGFVDAMPAPVQAARQ